MIDRTIGFIVAVILTLGISLLHYLKRYYWNQSTIVKLLRSEDDHTLCVLGGRPGFIYKEKHINDRYSAMPPSIPPIIYTKTHKTGSGTIANILDRMADVRQLRVMTNQIGYSKLGWPEPFPGEAAQRKRNFKHGIDVITAHAVYNKKLMEYYMKPHPFRFTTLREPFAQQVSMYNFFYLWRNMTWDDYIYNATITNEESVLIHRARMRNSQSFDLGWYQQMNNSFAYDHDRERIDAFIASIDRDFDLVICMEDMDRGLVLLSHMLGVSVNEMVNVAVAHHGEHDQYVYPSPEEYRTVIEELNPVDVALYNHFCPEKFESKWNATKEQQNDVGGQSFEQGVVKLQAMNRELSQSCVCSNGDFRKCHLSLLVGEDPYQDLFIKRQKHPDKIFLSPEHCSHLQEDVRHRGGKVLSSIYPLCDQT